MDNAIMPDCILGERERFPNHSSDPLTQGIVPALHVCSFTGLFANTQVLGFGKNAGISLPKVAEGTAVAVGVGYPIPKLFAGRLAPVPVDVGHYLPRPAAFMTFRLQCRPCPHFVAPLLDITADLIKLQYVAGPCLGQAVRHRRQPLEFF